MNTAASRIIKFTHEYAQMRGLDPETVYGLNRGDASEAEITITDLRMVAYRAHVLDVLMTLPEPIMRKLPSGNLVHLEPLLFNRWRLLVTRPEDVEAGHADDVWEFPDAMIAAAAFFDWDGRGEPVMWDRHPTTGRYREGGVG